MKEISFVQPYRNHHSIFNNCSIVRCDHCQMVFVDPMPDKTLLAEYNSGYFDNAHGGVNTHPLTTAFVSAINLLRVLYVESYIEKNRIQVKKVLEIGPGGGYFAKHWLSRHPGNEKYAGVESDKICYPKLSSIGIEIFSNVNELPAAQEFDLVVISHVLEHTADPRAFIHDCTKQLSDGGVLFIEVPCRDFEHKELDEPHLLFFDKGPIGLFLQTSGFGSIQTSYHGNTITDLKHTHPFYKKIAGKLRNRLLGKGVLFPFSGFEKGLEEVSDPLERACVKPFKAHVEQKQPSWWLRAISIKNNQ